MGAMPAVFAAPTLDMAEEVMEEQAGVTLEGELQSTVSIPTEHDLYGVLIYFEDFEDGSAGNSYTPFEDSAYIWSAGNVVDNPVGGGKAFISTETYLQFIIKGTQTVNVSEVTYCVDFLNYDGVTSNIPVRFLDAWLDPWDYWTNGQISKTEWTTMVYNHNKSETLIPGESGNLKFGLGGKGMYIDNVRVYAKPIDAEYTEKPEEYSEDYGNLVYFDNFSGENFENVADVEILGPGSKEIAPLGKFARANDAASLGADNLSGLFVKAADGTTFRYTDGRVMDGTFTLQFEIYNGTSSNRTHYPVADKQVENWWSANWPANGYNTPWSGSKSAIAGQWTTVTNTFTWKGVAGFGYLNSENLKENIAIGSVALYFKPKNAVTFVDGYNVNLIDISDTEKVVIPETSSGLNGWRASDGTECVANSVVPVSVIVGKTFTAASIEYVAEDYDITVSGVNEIQLEKTVQTYNYSVAFTPVDFENQGVMWSVSDTSLATIDEDGVLTPVKPGTVTVTATADYYPRKSASIDVEIKEYFDYTEKPAEYSADYGNLVYFDNFSGENFGNVADVEIWGPGTKDTAVSGKYAKLNDGYTLSDEGHLSGLFVKAADGETFRYTDGRVMDGTFTLQFEMYNSTDENYGYQPCVDKNPGGWDNWPANQYFTAWGGTSAIAGQWTLFNKAFPSSGKGGFGYLNSSNLKEKVAIASVSLYFKPNKTATFVDGDKTIVLDVGGTDKIVIPETIYGLNGWKADDGTEFVANSIIPASALEGKTFTASFVEVMDFDMAVVGEENIEVDNTGKTYSYSAAFTPADFLYKDVTWSVSDESLATIDKDGNLTPLLGGTVTVTATADYNPDKKASIDVVIDYKEGFEAVNVVFEGDLETVPESFKAIPGTKVDLSKYLDVKPADENKRFNGWSVNGVYSTGVVEVPFGSDLYITAVVNYDINFALSQNLSAYYNGGTYTQQDDMWVCAPGNKEDVFLNISGLNIPADRFSGMEWYLDVNYTKNGEAKTFKVGEQFNEFYFSTPDTSYNGVWGGMSVTGITEDGKYAIITMTINHSKWTGNVTTLRFDLLGNDFYGYNFRYIRFIEKPMGEDSSVTLTALTEPETGYVPDTTVKIAESFAKVDSVTWSCDENDSFLATGNFNEKTVYTVTIKLSSKDSKYVLNENTTVTIDGKDAVCVYGDDGAVYASYTYDATSPFLEFDAAISGPDVVTRDDRSYQYNFVLTNSEVPDKSVIWSIESIDGENVAVITQDGKLKAKKNGKVKITAVSNYNSAVVRELEVVVEDLVEEYVTISFDKATEAEVSGMPEGEITILKGEIVPLPAEIPVREGYVFLGWTDSVDSVELINEIEATDDKVICALWGTSTFWNFNNDTEGFREYNGNGTVAAGENYLIVETTNKNDVRLVTPAIELDPQRYNRVEVRLSVTTSGTVDLFYSADESAISGDRVMKKAYTGSSLDEWQTILFDFSNVSTYMDASNITRFWLDPFDAVNTTSYIDYIHVIDNNKNVIFDANGGVLPAAYAEGLNELAGTKISLTEKATLDGYEFICWSKTPDGTKPVFDFVLRDDETLYAVYGKALVDTTESITVEDGNAILLEAEADTLVTLSYETAEGTATWSGKTNENGYAIAELEAGVIENISVTPSNATATLTTDETAFGVANAERFEEEYEDDDDDSEGSGSGTSKNHDKTVVDVTLPGTIIPEGGSDKKSVASELSTGETVVLEFDEAYQKALFSEVSASETGSTTGGVLSYRVFSKKPGAKVTPTFVMDDVSVDTTKYKYIIIRARQTGFENPILRIFFKNKDIKSYTKLASVFHKIGSEYAVYVYDMAANKNWNGTIDSLKMVMENNSTGTLDIDWMIFTDEIPEDTTEFNNAEEIFEVVRTEEMNFSDVAKSRWSYNEICQSYSRGFVNGRGENEFAPFDNVTLAEAITVAVRINRIFNELPEVEASATGNWYDSYVEAAIKAKIVRPGQFADYNRPATRREVAIIMSKCVPSYFLNAINMFEEIADVANGSEGAKQILRLYCAGVLTGSDENYSFLPENNITREEFAAIANRVALPGARKRIFTDLERIASRKIYEGSVLNSIQLWSCTNNNFAVGKDGIARTVSDGTDPIALIHTMTGNLNGKETQKIKLGLVWNKDDVELVPQLYYATVSANSFAWQRMFPGTIGETDENGVTEIVFDVTTQSAFQDTITQLRFDPFDITGKEFGLAYVIIE